jgi:hypothetical protein
MESLVHDTLRNIHGNYMRLAFVLVTALGMLLLIPLAVEAHHGWEWATEEEFEITGEILEVSLGNPHGQVMIEAGNEEWIVQVGQPWRNDKAGLTETILSPGVSMTVHGHRSAREGQRVVKAESVVIDGVSYVLYPSRD